MQIGKTDCPSVQMSFNTMLEGFERHAATTGQENPMEMMRKQNEAIKTDLQGRKLFSFSQSQKLGQ